MAKYSGKIGFVRYVTNNIGVSEEQVTEKHYKGDVLQNFRRNEVTDKLSEDLSLGNEISVIANSFAISNFSYMRYATYLGTKWAIKSARIEEHRIILTLGGVYNGPTGPSADTT